jgi:hypothetical protein
VVDLSKNIACVIDQGMHVELARRLARDFAAVYFYQPWKWAFPRLVDAAVGEGVPEIQRVYNLWDVIDQVDLFVFPDVLDGDLQAYLRGRGHRVWGSGKAEILELDRMEFLQRAEEVGITTPATRQIMGIDELRGYLETVENKWVKVSTFRGDCETYHHINRFCSEPWLNDVQKKLGPLGHESEFLVCDNVEGVELAYDGFTVDGEFPDKTLFGYEIKDMGYCGKVKPYSQLSVPLREVNAAFAPILKSYQCRSFVAFEARIGWDGIPVVIDPCMRSGSPPTEVNQEMWSNFSEILWEGASGKMVSPIPVASYAVMAIIRSNYANSNWMALALPEQERQWIKLKNLCMLDGQSYCVPGDVPMPEIGAVVGLGNSLEQALERVNAIAPAIQGYEVEVCLSSLDTAQERIAEGERYGIRFD